MKQVIIGIHGLGNKPPKDLLQKWWQDAMVEGLKNHGFDTNLPKFEMIYWTDVMYKDLLDPNEQNRENPLFIDEPYTKAPENIEPEDHSLRRKIVDFISQQLNKIFLNPDKTLNYSFLTDLLLKKYFRDLDIYYMEECKNENDVTCKARDIIRNRIAQTILKYKNYDIFIVAHSMGSIVVFDVLNYLIPKTPIHTLVTIGSPLGLPIVISKIAAEQKLKQNGRTRITTPPGIKSKWYNMADIMDHVALNFKLSDDFLKIDNGVSPTDYLVTNNYQINGAKNPHKSFGYLRTYEFSKILHEFIAEQKLNLGEKVIEKVKGLFNKVKEKHEEIKDHLKHK